ncbi:transglutaminase-like domain-containing protein [Thermococcus waiotapuensis]|uniref:Transglutaminase-like domain-containing protein n=1 Tax=Thermococcus waiotapuensis TaxID=90909 RepID=A0AAE4NWR1_9EURY|nr:transglutaminase-like domain-containing protein [Thermococcus waiotapuensis]MDV3103846.1 transglutaminase-like domain-containing protein [Thermococcus waiotapuensis]
MSRVLKAISLILVALVVFVSLDVAYNDGELSRRYLPQVFNLSREAENAIREKISDKITGDPIEEALEKHLNNRSEIQTVGYLAAELKGSDILESAWNILRWEDEHISYDFSRREPLMRPIPQILTSERGICGDYTLLTLAILVQMNYTELYAMAITFNESDAGHLTAVINYNGKFLVVDQHPPVMDIGSYYWYWSVYRVEYLNESPQHIKTATLYRITVENSERIKVEKAGELEADDFLKEDYSIGHSDLEGIKAKLLSRFKGDYGLKEDPSLQKYGETGEVPPRYSRLYVFKVTFPGYAEFYFPEGEDYFVEDLYEKLRDSEELKDILPGSKAIWVDVTESKGSLIISLYVAT